MSPVSQWSWALHAAFLLFQITLEQLKNKASSTSDIIPAESTSERIVFTAAEWKTLEPKAKEENLKSGLEARGFSPNGLFKLL